MTVASFDISVRIEIRVKLRDSSYRTGLVMGSSTFAAAYFRVPRKVVGFAAE